MEKAAKPATAVPDRVLTSASVKPLDISIILSEGHVETFHAVFVVSEPNQLKHPSGFFCLNLTSSKKCCLKLNLKKRDVSAWYCGVQKRTLTTYSGDWE